MCCENCIALAEICPECLERGVWMFSMEGEEPTREETPLVDVVALPREAGDNYEQGSAHLKWVERHGRVALHAKWAEEAGLTGDNYVYNEAGKRINLSSGGHAGDFGTPLTHEELIELNIELMDAYREMRTRKHKYRNVQMGHL